MFNLNKARETRSGKTAAEVWVSPFLFYVVHKKRWDFFAQMPKMDGRREFLLY